MSSYSTGDYVSWAWGNGRGTIRATYPSKTTKTLQGSEITRDGSDDTALLSEQADGDRVLKLESEVRK